MITLLHIYSSIGIICLFVSVTGDNHLAPLPSSTAIVLLFLYKIPQVKHCMLHRVKTHSHLLEEESRPLHSLSHSSSYKLLHPQALGKKVCCGKY